jgi:uncharacterized protein DUF5615
MRVLLDECLPRRLKAAISGHEVSTVPEMGWAGYLDRDVLEEAAKAHFDAFITVDRAAPIPTSRVPSSLAIIALAAPSNRLSDLIVLVPKMQEALETIRPGQVVRIARTEEFLRSLNVGVRPKENDPRR